MSQSIGSKVGNIPPESGPYSIVGGLGVSIWREIGLLDLEGRGRLEWPHKPRYKRQEETMAAPEITLYTKRS